MSHWFQRTELSAGATSITLSVLPSAQNRTATLYEEAGALRTFHLKPLRDHPLARLAIAILFWTLHTLRLKGAVAGARNRLLSSIAEQERSAQVLHESLLQDFQGIVLQVQGIAKNLSVQGTARRQIEEVPDRSDDMLAESRRRLSQLRRCAVTAKEFGDRAAQYGLELSNTSCANFTFSITGSPRTLKPIVGNETYDIVAKALRRAFVNAGPSRIKVEINYSDCFLSVRSRDDGGGFGNDGAGHEHFCEHGLTDLQTRAQALGADLNISSHTSKGTESKLIVPEGMAYELTSN